jgi:outer membrane protein assembly factor BamA
VQAQLPTSFEYRVYYHFTDKDSLFKPQGVQLTETFTSDSLANSYIKNLSLLLISSGYLAASVDSILKDSTVYHVQIFAGNRYTLNELRPGNAEKEALVSAGYYKKKWKDRALNLADVYALRNRLLDYYENNGYPFAAVSLDSIQLDETSFSASLYVDKSVAYTIDSIRVMGDAVLKPLYLQHYLGIKYGSLYNGEKIKSVDKKIRDLTFVKSVQPADVTMTGSGSVLNVYLNKQRSSKVNFIIGFLPDPSRDGKLQMTGDVDLDLKNMLRSGESLILKWQQLQKGSPRLNLGFNLPYVFKSSFGLEGLFDMYKKDSSFLQLSAQTGLQYTFSASKVGKFVVQFQGSNLLAGGVDTNLVKSSKKLPDIIDMTAVNTGFQVDWYQTDYRYNPSSGFEWNASALVGIKKVKPNQDILSLKDPLFDYASLYDSITTKNYQFNLTARGAKYFLVKKNLVLKVGVQGGFYYSPQIFRNDQYRIGGFRTLRGFDEEGIFTDKYGIGTAELRLISGMNSYLYMFSDFAYTGNSVSSVQNTFISAGIGILLETKVGLLNVSYAAGKRNDVPFNLREASKLHLGYINYF